MRFQADGQGGLGAAGDAARAARRLPRASDAQGEGRLRVRDGGAAEASLAQSPHLRPMWHIFPHLTALHSPPPRVKRDGQLLRARSFSCGYHLLRWLLRTRSAAVDASTEKTLAFLHSW